MKVQDLIAVLNANVPYTYFPDEFPPEADDNCAMVRIQPGSPPTIHVERPSFQVLVRALHPADAEQKAYDVYNFFNQQTDLMIGDKKAVFIQAQGEPFFLRIDENNRYEYSVNFTTIMNV